MTQQKNIHLPFSAACERNAAAILSVLENYIPKDQKGSLLEIGSGTGQHAFYLAPSFPKLHWWTSDRQENHDHIQAWKRQYEKEYSHQNFKGPLFYEVGINQPPKQDMDYCFSANTLHIMSWSLVKNLIHDLGKTLKPHSLVFFYGPFRDGKAYSSESNHQFDLSLQSRDPLSGIRDKNQIFNLMNEVQFELLENLYLPANNEILVFKKK